MRLILEEHKYKAKDINPCLKPYCTFSNRDNEVKFGTVGYYYNSELDDCVFFLPKVLMDKNDKVFGKYDPNDLLEPDKYEKKLSTEEKDFLTGFALWIYRTVKEYRKLNPKSEIVKDNSYSSLGTVGKHVDKTYLDVVLSLLEFYAKNRNFVLFTAKNSHSGQNRINWRKTIGQQIPSFENDIPIYLNTINRKKVINYDEDLLVFFFSILNDINKRFHFKIPIDINYPIISSQLFEQYRKSNIGQNKLRRIKYRYFSDKQKQMWELCYQYMDASAQIHQMGQCNDYLLVDTFEKVFENMIDVLISDKDKCAKEIWDQKDGKLVDHVFPYDSLISPDEIYYLGDSKYYKIGHGIEDSSESKYKQFTYARNVIQYNLSVFLDEKPKHSASNPEGWVKYRDDITEGYNITPNFFISADIDKQTLSNENDNLRYRLEEDKITMHFRNRIFDRDTLLLSHYDINFLYVVSLYTSDNNYEKERFKEKAHEHFKSDIIQKLDRLYAFYALAADEDQYEDLLNLHFRELLGKAFQPFENEQILVIGLDKSEKYKAENEALINNLKKDFVIEPFFLKDGAKPAWDKAKKKICQKSENTMASDKQSDLKEDVVQEIPIQKLFIEAPEDVDWSKRYRTHISVWSVKAACGKFGMNTDYDEEGWIDISNYGLKASRSMFAVHAKGNSMEPKIHDGDLCIFELYPSRGGSREGEIVLTQRLDFDNDYGCSWTIKKYYSTKVSDGEGSWHHESIILKSLNQAYNDIILNASEIEYYKTIGILVKVLQI